MPDDSAPPRPQPRIRSARALAARLEQLARVLASQALAHGLNSAQWTALRYLAAADEQARHVGAFAAFHLTTASSASQTLSALVRKGLVAKRPGGDARRRTLSLTEAGHLMLAQDPLGKLLARLDGLSELQFEALTDALEALAGVAPAPR
ncbi:MAG TPA: MarR family winged helix-turn-helix transcriptional regulator [Alphaproteobacteria bacterium]|nr:MarR family winged helix-turn-helix transcriptional regulator [Alphaproteobacteria bacterium]